MSLIVDIIIITIIGFSIFLGYKRGLTGSLIKILSFVIALVISLLLFHPISEYVINNTQIDETLETSIIEIFEKEEENKHQNEIENETSNQETTIATPIMDYMNNQIKNTTKETKNNVVQLAARNVAVTIIKIGIIIILFICARFILMFVRGLTKIITNLPLIKQIDKIGGIAFGSIQGFAIVFIGLAIISFASPLINNYIVAKMVGESLIGNILYNNNILLKLIF